MTDDPTMIDGRTVTEDESIEPNEQQQTLIESLEGIHLVDAGAGTGKTFTVTRRYANILESTDAEPEDVLLMTFTDNAATEMTERIVSESGYERGTLINAPIGTFHSRCHEILLEYGFDAPEILGIDDRITRSTRIVEDEVVERESFREFFRRFRENHPEYADYVRVLPDPETLLDVLTTLATKGVFPTADGWFRNGEDHLDGDFEAFETCFDELNEPRNDGRKQSVIREKLGSYGRNQCYPSDAPSKTEIRGEGTKTVSKAVARLAFDEDRDGLKAFVHDVYFAYLQFALQRNYLNFSFLQIFAFALLCENHEVRESIAFDYVTIDEFQDTSEIQFKIALLLAGTDNLCVVGDWKQSIYGFQGAAVENIQSFETRLGRFVEELDDGHERVGFEPSPITEIDLLENYRSTADILRFSERALTAPATSGDDVDSESIREKIVSLESNTPFEHSRIEAFGHDEEYGAILTKIQEIVGNEAYQVEAGGELRPPHYGDIAVLTRTRDFGRELLGTARNANLPMAYEGGIELFRTDQAKLLLAWLRILESNENRGWAVVLERAGYTVDEISYLLDSAPYPASFRDFRSELETQEHLGGVIQRIFSRYGFDGETAAAVLETIQSVYDTTTMTRGDLIGVIERAIDAGSTHEVHAGMGTNAVTVQTIHATKGLEHPIVILANMNDGTFPCRGHRSGAISVRDPIGLRQRTVFATDHGYEHVYDNWRSDVLRWCLPSEYDEERRLLYVAMTRARDHLLFSAGSDPNTFLESLPVTIETVEPDVDVDRAVETTQSTLDITVATAEGPIGCSAHDLMDEDVFETVADGEGTAFGTAVHENAEAYARDGDERANRELRDGDPESNGSGRDDIRHVQELIDSLDGELLVEEQVTLPLSVGDEQVTISGIVDLVHVTAETVEVIDYKTDRTRRGHDEYRKQLSVYYHVLDDWFPKRTVTARLYYTAEGESVPIDPHSRRELTSLVDERIVSGGS